MSVTGRFARFLQRDDRAKEIYLREIAAGHEDSALEQMNSETGGNATTGTLRGWLREDPDFAKALQVARQGEVGEPQVIDLNETLCEMVAAGEVDLPGGARRWT